VRAGAAGGRGPTIFAGSLIKAPKFQDQPDFKKEENGLFPIHLHVTDKGFIFLNFSAEEPEPFESYFGDLPLEWAHLPVDEYEYAYSWSVVGSYNWKTLMDGYQGGSSVRGLTELTGYRRVLPCPLTG
jgi:phenylpropionate dioxygenase-like ring-hydroxylating dioxygenase large terminal subunit